MHQFTSYSIILRSFGIDFTFFGLRVEQNKPIQNFLYISVSLFYFSLILTNIENLIEIIFKANLNKMNVGKNYKHFC